MSDSPASEAAHDDVRHESAARFLRALREDDAARARDLLAAHPGIAGYSIHTAAAVGDAEAVQAFLAADARSASEAAAPGGVEPLILAAHAGLQRLLAVPPANAARTVDLLLNAGASPNAFLQFGETEASRVSALYFACVSDNVPVVQRLLERGAEPNDGESVYHAAEWNHRDCLGLLLAHGADLSARSVHHDNTPLRFLAGYKELNPRCASATLGMEWLLEHGADPTVPSYVAPKYRGRPEAGETPLHRVAADGRPARVAGMLLEHGASVDARRADGRTAYALAVRAGNAPAAELLAAAGADTGALSDVDRLLAACMSADEPAARSIVGAHPALMGTLTDDDRAAFALAIEEARVESVRLMLALGWSVVDESAGGGTPLHHAAWYGRAAVVRLLADAGAPVNARDTTFGSSPIAWAAHGSVHARPGRDDEYIAVVELLLDAGSSREASYNAWNESPESLASPAVAGALAQRGFTR